MIPVRPVTIVAELTMHACHCKYRQSMLSTCAEIAFAAERATMLPNFETHGITVPKVLVLIKFLQ